MQAQTDVITWRVIVSVLAVACTTLLGMLYGVLQTRLSRMEVKINGIIRFLITHSENGEKEDLSNLIGE